MTKEISGNQCLIVTPLNQDESVDEESTRRMVDFLIREGVHGILVHGSTGEGFLFDTDERKTYAKLIVNAVNGRVPVGFCVESSSTAVSVDLSKYAKKVGVDYLFTTAPYRHPHKGNGIFEHFKAIRGRAVSGLRTIAPHERAIVINVGVAPGDELILSDTRVWESFDVLALR